jgi:hypothetical protein
VSTAAGAGLLRFAVPDRHRFRQLQALEDAVNYRAARLMVPCSRCEPGRDRCDEHACDVALVAGYLEAAEVIVADLARMNRAIRESGLPWQGEGR